MYKTSKYVVVGVARNVSGTIKSDIERIMHAIPSKNVKWFIVESDSTDETVKKLEILKKELENFNYISMGELSLNMKERVQRISFCRNVYLNEVKTNSLYNDVEYVVVADLDGLNSDINREAFDSCFVRCDWAACTANQVDCYYDIFALRHDSWNPGCVFSQIKFIERYPNSEFKGNLTSSLVYSKMIKIPADAPWIEVDSAFGGIALYRKEFFVLGSYNYLDKNGEICCEHVNFHEEISRHGGRIFINPAFINAKNTEHDRYAFRHDTVRPIKRIYKSLKKRMNMIKLWFSWS